jgi:hypothetical protein
LKNVEVRQRAGELDGLIKHAKNARDDLIRAEKLTEEEVEVLELRGDLERGSSCSTGHAGKRL